MRKLYIPFALVLALTLLGAACRSSPRTGQGDLPDIVRNARRSAPEDVLIGIGSANMASQHQSRLMAESRARAEIARVLDTMVQQMIRDFTAGSEIDHTAVLTFQEDISVQLTRARLQGAYIADEAFIRGTYYVVVHLRKEDVGREIDQARAAAALRTPAMASFDAQARMNQAFYDAARQEPQVADR